MGTHSYTFFKGDYTAKGNAWINSTYPGINFILTAAVLSKGDGAGGGAPARVR